MQDSPDVRRLVRIDIQGGREKGGTSRLLLMSGEEGGEKKEEAETKKKMQGAKEKERHTGGDNEQKKQNAFEGPVERYSGECLLDTTTTRRKKKRNTKKKKLRRGKTRLQEVSFLLFLHDYCSSWGEDSYEICSCSSCDSAVCYTRGGLAAAAAGDDDDDGDTGEEHRGFGVFYSIDWVSNARPQAFHRKSSSQTRDPMDSDTG